MRAKSLVATACLVVLTLGLTAPPVAAGGGGGGVCGAVSEGPSLAVRDFCFDGAAHMAEPAQTVNVVNYGETAHDITASDGSFASGMLEPGETFKVTLGSEQVVPFYCTLHGSADGAGMAGVFVTTATGSASVETPARGQAASARGDATVTGAEAPVANEAIEAALAAATQSAKTDSTVALVVVTIIGMAVAFGLGLMVWAMGRIAPSGSGSPS